MKYKILIVDAFKSTGGEEEVAFYLYKNIDRKKFDVYISSPQNSPYFKKHIPENDEWFKCDFRNKLDFKSIIKFRKFIKEKNINLVNVHGYIAGFYIRVALVGLPIKVVWTMHVDIMDVPNLTRRKKLVRKFIEDFFNRFFTSKIVCVSKSLANRIPKWVSKRTPVEVIYNGIDTKIFKSTSAVNKIENKQDLILGFISRLSIQKGIPFLLESVKELANLNVNFKLLIVGEGDLRKDVEKFIAANSLQKYVEILGFKKDVSLILNKIDVLILPSLFEGFPMIILESLATATPVIASNVNGIPEIIQNGKNGFLTTPKNPHEITESILKYYKNRSFIKDHGEYGSEQVHAKFTVTTMIDNYENIFLESLN